jgi:predicted RNase H-like nuclease
VAESTLIAVGVDGAPRGWIAACLYASGPEGGNGRHTRLALCEDISEIAERRAEASGQVTVTIDVPIGLPETVGLRRCDKQARLRLGERRNSVFSPPARYMLAAAGDYARIRGLVEERRKQNRAEKSLSAQAAGLTPKIAEVDAFVRGRKDSEEWLWECHPELSFSALNGGGLSHDKYRAAGVLERLRLLRSEFPDLEEGASRRCERATNGRRVERYERARPTFRVGSSPAGRAQPPLTGRSS